MYVCLCKNVTEKQICKAVSQGHCSMKALCKELGVAGQCGKCAKDTRQLLRQVQKTTEAMTGSMATA
jgi:bacterioferritin-associated ferredoxin